MSFYDGRFRFGLAAPTPDSEYQVKTIVDAQDSSIDYTYSDSGYVENIDVTEDEIKISILADSDYKYNDGDFNGWFLEDSYNNIASIVDVIIIDRGTTFGISKSSIYFTNDRIEINGNTDGVGPTLTGNYQISLRVVFESDFSAIRGDVYSNIIRGTGNDDLIEALGGSDTAYGGGGDDYIYGNSIAENGKSLGDTSDIGDSLFGEAGQDVIFGNQGDDFIDGGGRSDTLYGGRQSDTIVGAGGRDLIFGDGNSSLERQESDEDGNDDLDGGAGSDTIFGGGGDDHIFGGGGNDYVVGGSGGDFLRSNNGQDTIVGGSGKDDINGGAGNDDLIGGADGDIFKFSDAYGHDTIHDFYDGLDKIHLRDIREENGGIPVAMGQLITRQAGLGTIIRLDLDGNGKADQIDLNGDGRADSNRIDVLNINPADLTEEDFIF